MCVYVRFKRETTSELWPTAGNSSLWKIYHPPKMLSLAEAECIGENAECKKSVWCWTFVSGPVGESLVSFSSLFSSLPVEKGTRVEAELGQMEKRHIFILFQKFLIWLWAVFSFSLSYNVLQSSVWSRCLNKEKTLILPHETVFRLNTLFYNRSKPR